MFDFSDEYQSWLDSEGAARSGIQLDLVEHFRESWRYGDDEDRALILWFITETRCEDGFDLIIEGICSANFNLASHASACLLALACIQINLGDRASRAIFDYLNRFQGRTADTFEAFQNVYVQNGWTFSTA